MKKQTNYINSIFVFLFILVVSIWVTANINWGSHRYTRIIKVDGNGYYAYLPATFIYHDLNFGFFDEIRDKYHPSNFDYDYRYDYKGNTVDKYYCGTALAMAPFFLMGHIITSATDLPADGYSYYYLLFISIAAIFYLMIAVIYLDKVLKVYINSQVNRMLVVLLMVFGTNLFYYTVHEPSMSHVYSLAFITLYLYCVQQYFISFKRSSLIASAIFLGIIVLIRPVNIIIIFAIPFFAGDLNTYAKGIKQLLNNYLTLISAVLVFCIVVSLQLIIYKIQTGSYLIYSYADEGFNFLHPHIWKFLFSYKKGLFVYTPITFLALAGGYFLFRKNKFQFWTITGFLLIVVYILSSWQQWYYGGSFSSRVMIEYLPAFMILLAFLLQGIKGKRNQIAMITLLALLVIVCQIQTYQYYVAQIHWEDMDKQKYWDVFLRIDKLIK